MIRQPFVHSTDDSSFNNLIFRDIGASFIDQNISIVIFNYPSDSLYNLRQSLVLCSTHV